MAMTYDQWMTALCVWREARNQPDTAMCGVIHVILNRIKDPRWPSNAAEVITQKYQFSSFLAGDPNVVRFPVRRNKADWAAWERVCTLVESPGPDPTGGANSYESCPDDAEPSWAKNVIARLGDFEYYKV